MLVGAVIALFAVAAGVQFLADGPRWLGVVNLLFGLARQNTLTAAYHAHPQRFGRRPHPPIMPTQFWINEPLTASQINRP